MKKTMIALAVLCSIQCFSKQSAQTAKKDIQKVLVTYFNAVVSKDSIRFCNLFALDSVSFFGVNAPETYQAYLKKYPKAQFLFKDNYKSFIHFVVSSKKKAEEEYRNTNIWNDNTIATLSFNYSFWIDDKKTNWGIETWQLLYNGKEWKILSALFSINDPQVIPDPAQKT